MEGFMFDARRRQLGRLFFLLLIAGISHGQGPATTTINDVVFRADSTPAARTLLISWPPFITANGEAVAAGTKSVTLGPPGCAFGRPDSKYRRDSGKCLLLCGFSFG